VIVTPASNEARTAEFKIILSSKLLPISPEQASAIALDTALELFNPIPAGICDCTFTFTRLSLTIPFGRSVLIIFLSKSVPGSG
jgi:hypothetical protein